MTADHTPRPVRRRGPGSSPLVRAVVALAGALALLAPLVSAAPAVAATRVPAAAARVPATLEDHAGFTPAISCEPTTKPGSAKLGALLTKTYPNTRYGGARSCGASPNSEHHDGRAVDWMNSIRDKTQAAQAKAVLTWLFATDAAGNEHANARRLGIMYIIWDGKIWGAYNADAGWRPYSSCAKHKEKSWDTTCHRDHMHFSLSWAGAMGRTSYWTGKVAAPDYGPCRPADLSWAAPYKKVNAVRCPRYATVPVPEKASATLKTLITYSGIELRLGASGAGVKAVQKAVRTTASGRYDAKTKAAVKKWQKSRKLNQTGNVYASSWRVLIKEQSPKK